MKKKFLFSAVVSILICLCLMGGATFALFTDKAQVNVAVTAGNVDIDAKVVGIKTYTETTLIDEGEKEADFENGGVATLNENVVTVERMTPMDKVVVTILLENHSNVNIKYRTTFADVTVLGTDDVALFPALEFATQEEGQGVVKIGTGTITDWAMIKAANQVGTTIKTVDLIVEFPDHGDADNQYMNGICNLAFTIEAVQGNAPVQVSTADQFITALANGENVKLTSDIALDSIAVISENTTVDLNNYKVTSTAKKAFEVYANATIKNGTIEAVNRCVDTRKAVDLTLENVTLIADNHSSYGNPQPLTIGGSENGTKVNMTNVTISAAKGYSIISFVQADVTATNCTISGYNALYVKPGSDNSTFNFVNSTLSGSTVFNDVEGNSFSTIAVRANNVTVDLDAASVLSAEGNYCYAISFGTLDFPGEEGCSGSKVTVKGTINANADKVVSNLSLAGNTVVLP